MIVVKLMGGLGNQMFQYAAARRLSHVSKVGLKLDINWFNISSKDTTPRQYALYPFSMSEDFISSADSAVNLPLFKSLTSLARRFYPFDRVYRKEKQYHFDPTMLTPRKKAYLEGYWQSEKYFSDIREILVSEFTLKKKPDGLNKSLAGRIIDQSISSVSLHIRRGDYVINQSVINMHGSCSMQYYATAISKIASEVRNPHFFVFSDDPLWVSGNFAMEHPFTIVGHNASEEAHEDLRLMTLCKHHIIANSTFSWWGAWLCNNPDKIIIAPQNWFNDKTINTDDLLPEKWLRI